MNICLRSAFMVVVCLILAANLCCAGDELPKACEAYKKIPFPAGDMPRPGEIKDSQHSAYDLYYGTYIDADPRKARLYAYDEMRNKTDDGPFNGEAILMTIYANGKGAKRNFDLAIKLACSYGGAPAEWEGRVQHLLKLKEQNWRGTNFSICDDATSGYLAGFCADHAEKFASKAREAKLDALISKWTGKEKKDYASLRKTAGKYFEIHAENEVDSNGTAHTAMYIADTAKHEKEFVAVLTMLDQKKLPKYSPEQVKDADVRLNSVYQKVQKRMDPDRGGTVTKESIRETQRAWLKYRDAWTGFCKRKYPDRVPADLQTYLTLERIKELEEFIE